VKGIDRRGMAVLSLAHVFDDINQSFLPALLPFLVLQRGFTNEKAAFLMLAASVASSVVQPAIGYLADRRSIPWLIPIGMFFAAAGGAVAGVMPSYVGIIVVVTISGIGVAAFHPEAARYANYVSGSKKATGMSFFAVGGNVGFALGPIVATPLLIAFGPAGTLFALFPAAIWAVVLFIELPRLRTFAPTKRPKKIGVGEDRWGRFALLTSFIVVRSIAFTGIITFVPLYAIQVVHASVPQANTALAALLVCGAIGTVIGGRIIDRIGRIPVLLISMFSAGPLLVAFIVATGSGAPYAIAGCIAIAGLVGLLFVPSQTAFVVLAQEYLPNHLGIAAGVSLGLAISLGGAAAPLLGRLGDRSGLTATMWANVALIGIAGALAIVLALVSQRTNRTAPDHTRLGNPSDASAS
jgi:FSR family fosmidomycin resistance protein-like MFS transporter